MARLDAVILGEHQHEGLRQAASSCAATDRCAGPWYCVQLGAREHYAVPRGLARLTSSVTLVTEAWVTPRSLWARLSPRLAQRFHADLVDATVHSWTTRAAAFELAAALRGRGPRELTMARNEWFERSAERVLDANANAAHTHRPTLFAYSYAARGPLEWAKRRGWRTVLGQIDPGPVEERIVADLHQRHSSLSTTWRPAPDLYWKQWREECRLADHIVVNSEWARQAVLEGGTPSDKVRVIPLAYEAPAGGRTARDYPQSFTSARPLRVLFLGQVNLRKGVAELFDAIRLLAGDPVEVWFVGPLLVPVPQDLRSSPRVRWHASVSRDAANQYYRDADVFILPTHSDGFGMTQLEALGHGLPVIASNRCGAVVESGVNGHLLRAVTPAAIAEALREVLDTPEVLRRWSAAAKVDDRFGLDAMARTLLSI